MSIYTYYSTALKNPDPYAACMYGLKKHPRYHDCENCDHARYGNCEYGIHTVEIKALERLRPLAEQLLDKATVKRRPLPP